MERRIQEFPGAITGEDSPRPVGAVCTWREADDDDASFRVAEAGHRASPVGLVAVGSALLARHLLAKGDEPRAAAASYDLFVQNAHHPCQVLPRGSDVSS
jgi:hypothetical protein